MRFRILLPEQQGGIKFLWFGRPLNGKEREALNCRCNGLLSECLAYLQAVGYTSEASFTINASGLCDCENDKEWLPGK